MLMVAIILPLGKVVTIGFDGEWLYGFLMPSSHTSILGVELEAMKFGVCRAWDQGFKTVWCETNSLEMFNLLQHTMDCRDNDLNFLVEHIRRLLARDWQIHVRHVFCSANMVADHLAKRGSHLVAALCKWIIPPSEICPFLSCDVTT